MSTIHIYLDESGNFDFSLRGSRYYIFTVAWTYEPKLLADGLTSLRFRLLKQGTDIDGFHATVDRQKNRDLVVRTLLSCDRWNFASVVVDKAKVNPIIREPHVFYPAFASMPLRFILRGRLLAGTSRCLVLTDRLPLRRHREAVIKAIKASCQKELPPGTPFHVYHHPRVSNKWLQVVDYCSWAIFRKWEGGDIRTYDQLRPRLAARELDVLKRGSTHYY